MSTNPLHREGGYWKPVLDYEHWEEGAPHSGGSDANTPGAQLLDKEATRQDVCRKCGAEFVVDSPFCRMCGRAREGVTPEVKKSIWHVLDVSSLRRRLGLSVGAMVCFIAGMLCVIAGIVTGFLYTAKTLEDWQAIQIWRSEWLVAAGVAFVCGILLNSRRATRR
jgi:ribosomal protein L40E